MSECMLSQEELAQGEKKNAFVSKSLAIGISPDFKRIVFFAEGKEVGSILSSALSYNEFAFQDGNVNKSLQVMKMAKGKKPVDMYILDDKGEAVSDSTAGSGLLSINITNSAIMNVISKAEGIPLVVKKS